MADEKKKPGRPKSVPVEDTEVNEQEVDRLEMSKKGGGSVDQNVTVDELTKQWRGIYNKSGYAAKTSGVQAVLDKWNKLNPFLQNQRVKNLYTQARKYSKSNISIDRQE